MAALHHLAFRTGDVARLARFYEQWFGLSIKREALPRSVWFALGTDAVLMIEACEPGEVRVEPGTLELCALRVTMSERDDLRQRLVNAGLLEGETEHTLYFRDPDGRRVGASSYAF